MAVDGEKAKGNFWIKEVISVKTQRHTELIDITAAVNQLIRKNGVKEGIAWLFVPHTTAGIFINEAADPTVCRDIEATLERLVPWKGGYQHLEGNAAAHIKAVLTGASQWVPVEDGRVKLGTWQGIFFCEFDGPRFREVWLRLLASAVD